MFSKMSYIKSSIGQKQIVGLMGLLLSLFILIHMLGNLLIFLGPKSYNEYGNALMSNPIIYVLEGGLLAAFLFHIILALKLSLKNYRARPQKYNQSAKSDKKTSFVTKTMWHQGVIVLVFVVLHLITFKYGTVYTQNYEGKEVRDLFRLVHEVFQSPVYVIWYLLALFILMFHLSHGLSSSLKTLGLSRPQHVALVEKMGIAYAILVGIGFASQPIYMFFLS